MTKRKRKRKGMAELGLLNEAKARAFRDAERCLAEIHAIINTRRNTETSKIAALGKLRRSIYEALNQIQHEYLIVRAAEWLISAGKCQNDIVWYWNPRQTGTHNEPDLRGKVSGRIAISAEVTTSEAPIGTIRTRMSSTLAKLAKMRGELFYFVRTEAMGALAEKKIAQRKWKIAVVPLPDEE